MEPRPVLLGRTHEVLWAMKRLIGSVHRGGAALALGVQWKQVLDGPQGVELQVGKELGQGALSFSFTQQFVTGGTGGAGRGGDGQQNRLPRCFWYAPDSVQPPFQDRGWSCFKCC